MNEQMTEQKFVNWDGLVYYDSKIKTYVGNNVAECLKFGGMLPFENIPKANELNHETVNYTYTVLDGFISDERFIEPNRVIPPKTTIQVVEVSKDVYKYSIFKEEEVSLQPVYEELEELRTQVDADLDKMQVAVEEQDTQLDLISNAQAATAQTVENLTESVDQLEGTVQSVVDLSNETDQKVDELSQDVIDLSKIMNTKADQQSLNLYATKADIAPLASEEDLAEVEAKIPSVEGLASETFVKAEIAKAQLDSDGDVDLSIYVTEEELNDRLDELIVYGEF